MRDEGRGANGLVPTGGGAVQRDSQGPPRAAGDRAAWILTLILGGVMGCGGGDTPAAADAATDSAARSDVPTGTDVPQPDAGPQDSGVDVIVDAGTDVPTDAGTDVQVDTGTDVPTDAGTDVLADTGVDVPADTGVDVPPIRFPGSPPRLGGFSTLGVRAWQSGTTAIVDDEFDMGSRICSGTGASMVCVTGGFVR